MSCVRTYSMHARTSISARHWRQILRVTEFKVPCSARSHENLGNYILESFAHLFVNPAVLAFGVGPDRKVNGLAREAVSAITAELDFPGLEEVVANGAVLIEQTNRRAASGRFGVTVVGPLRTSARSFFVPDDVNVFAAGAPMGDAYRTIAIGDAAEFRRKSGHVCLLFRRCGTQVYNSQNL